MALVVESKQTAQNLLPGGRTYGIANAILLRKSFDFMKIVAKR